MKNLLSQRHLLPALVLAGAQLATVGTAQAGWYGETTILNSDLDDTSLNSTGRNVNITFDEDVGFSSAIGYEFAGGLRLEGEYISTENDTEVVNFNGNTFEGSNARGGIETESLFLNLIKAFNADGVYSPYIGAGIGITDVESDVNYGAVANISDSDEAFSYQFLAGLDISFSESFTGFVEYRFLATDDVTLNRFGGPAPATNTSQEGDIEYDAFAIGLRYTFN